MWRGSMLWFLGETTSHPLSKCRYMEHRIRDAQLLVLKSEKNLVHFPGGAL